MRLKEGIQGKGKKTAPKKAAGQVDKVSPQVNKAAASPVTPSPAPVKNGAGSAKPTPSLTPVQPEVEYQEKSVVNINPSHRAADLSKPVKDTDKFADKDNSVDGFLAIKH